MYSKRIRLLIGLSVAVLLVYVGRLAQMQLTPDSRIQDAIRDLRQQWGRSQQLKTVRGRILDRNGRVLAADEPRFQLRISYRLSQYWDPRVIEAELLRRVTEQTPPDVAARVRARLDAQRDEVRQIIERCSRLGGSQQQIAEQVREINDLMWDLRTLLAWRRKDPQADPNLFESRFPDKDERMRLIAKVDDIPEMDQMYPLLELQTDDDVFAAQVEFMDTQGVEIAPQARRSYPYGSVAAQTIGWVGSATQEKDKQLFAEDRLASYLKGEVCGREDGVEYACEAILRGRRGELVYDIDRQLASRTETELGRDVTITVDIELQRRIQAYLLDERLNPNARTPMAAVVVEVASGDILAMVSLPSYDLHLARRDYGQLNKDPNSPLINRVLNCHYPPGSVVKPLILIAGLETQAITPTEVIPCPAQAAPEGWPSCWIWKETKRVGHDNQWRNEARNAIRGSCNIYFSRLADRLDPLILQSWLFRFGYGRQADLDEPYPAEGCEARRLRQAPGRIATSGLPDGTLVTSFEQIPPLRPGQKRLFGIGHGDLRVTPLQVADAFAAIARGGVYRPARLFLPLQPAPSGPADSASDRAEPLGISAQTLAVVFDGMRAVVAETGGTAYNAFSKSGLDRQDVQVYGKTGSTESPEHAWFAGFAQDSRGRRLAIALVVEGGQHGSADAAPLARDILQFCIEAGYIGRPLAAGPSVN